MREGVLPLQGAERTGRVMKCEAWWADGPSVLGLPFLLHSVFFCRLMVHAKQQELPASDLQKL